MTGRQSVGMSSLLQQLCFTVGSSNPTKIPRPASPQALVPGELFFKADTGTKWAGCVG